MRAGALTFAAALIGVIGLVAGCGGGSKASSVASLGTSHASNRGTSAPRGAVSTGGSFAPYAACLSSHGVAASTGPDGRGLVIQADVDPSASLFLRAQKACRKLMPGGGPPTESPAQQAERRQRALAITDCIHNHGFPSFPDPTGEGVLQLPHGFASSPRFRAVAKACGLPLTSP
jgi:hypothetical protein